jgi:hypothetical protein
MEERFSGQIGIGFELETPEKQAEKEIQKLYDKNRSARNSN